MTPRQRARHCGSQTTVVAKPVRSGSHKRRPGSNQPMRHRRSDDGPRMMIVFDELGSGPEIAGRVYLSAELVGVAKLVTPSNLTGLRIKLDAEAYAAVERRMADAGTRRSREGCRLQTTGHRLRERQEPEA